MPIIDSITSWFSSPGEAISMLIARLLIATLILPFHELAHGWVAYKLGDPTARWMGRLTLNPIKHFDPIGSVLMLLTGYGWAKGVPINPRNFKNEKKGMALTAIAGPVTNLLMALGLMILQKLVVIIYLLSGAEWLQIIWSILSFMVTINVVLGVFNLIPFPPLDGFRIVSLFLPDRIYYKITQYEQYFLYSFMAVLMLTDILDRPIQLLASYALYGLNFLTGFMDVITNLLLGGI